jgi:hypothetical protein
MILPLARAHNYFKERVSLSKTLSNIVTEAVKSKQANSLHYEVNKNKK